MSQGPSPSVRERMILLAVFAVASLWIASVSAGAQTASDWSQFQGDAAHVGVAVEGPAPPFMLAWHAPVEAGGPLGTQGLSAPVVAGDLVITVGPDQVVAFDLATGAEAWSVARTLGPPATPAVASVDGRTVLLYTEGWAGHPPEPAPEPAAASTTGGPSSSDPGAEQVDAGPVDSQLVAIDVETREPVWEPVELAEASRSGVTVEGDRAYVVDIAGEVVAIALDTGQVQWTVSVDRPVTTPPAAAGDVVVVTGRGDAEVRRASIVALDAGDGSEVWRQNVDVAGVVLPSSPAILDDVVVATFSDGTVRGYGLSDGAERWTARLGSTPTPFDSAAALQDGAAFVTDVTIGGSVFRVDLATGALVWDFAINEPIVRGAPVVSGGALLVATADGSLNAFDPATGERTWRYESAGALRSLTPAGSVVVGVRAGPDAGIDAFGADPDGELLREASPTTPDYLRIVGLFLIVAIPLAGGAFAGGRVLTARLGPAFTHEPDHPDDHREEPA